jgi:hypothetical protein
MAGFADAGQRLYDYRARTRGTEHLNTRDPLQKTRANIFNFGDDE